MLLVGIVCWSVLAHGLPELRHDWRFPGDPVALPHTFAGYASGWIDSGIGNAQPYPTFYLLAVPLWLLAKSGIPAAIIVGLVIAVSIFFAAHGAIRLARHRSNDLIIGLAAGPLAALNPWVFSKEVAGHVFMVLAYGVFIELLAEVTREKPRRLPLLLLATLTITQIEFYLIGALPLLLWSYRRRYYDVTVTTIIVSLPIALGLLLHLREVSATPYLLAWQQAMSVHIADAIKMEGYAPGYAHGFEGIAAVLIAIAILAAIGAIRQARNRFALGIFIGAALCTLYATGSTGVFAPAYVWIVQHVVASGVFRELYDLIALVPIAYIVAFQGLRGIPLLRNLAGSLTLFLIIPWIAHPAFTWFVPAAALPHIDFPNAPAFRVALEPEFQPLTYQRRGSGVDPDAYIRPGNATPINEALPSYPVDRALSEYMNGRNGYLLGALGVSRVVSRPYLQSDAPALAFQSIARIPTNRLQRPRHDLPPIPLLSLWQEYPQQVAIGANLWGNGIFVGDARAISQRAPTQSDLGLDATHAWVDARFATIVDPSVGSPFPAVFTISQQPLLNTCNTCHRVLISVAGRLVNQNGAIIAQRQIEGYHWANLAPRTTWLVCHGRCAVALFANLPSGLREEAPDLVDFQSENFIRLLPWLLSTNVRGGGTLRYNERYDASWAAFEGTHRLRHIQIDRVFNGWWIENSSTEHHLMIINLVAATQAFVMCLVGATLLVFYINAILSHSREPRSPREHRPNS